MPRSPSTTRQATTCGHCCKASQATSSFASDVISTTDSLLFTM
jgi:hypothetical protein